jgi:hypothetical protein
MVKYPLWLQATGGDPAINYAAQDDRELLSALFPKNGPIEGTDFLMTQRGAGANFSVDISAGRCAIVGSSNSEQGTALVRSTGVVNLTTPAAPGSGTRHHRVVAELLDKQAAGTLYGWQFHLVEDTGGGLPAAPASSCTLGQVNIAAGAASVTNASIANTSVQVAGRKYYASAVLNASYTINSGTNAVAGANYVASTDPDALFTSSSGGSFFTIPCRGRWEFRHRTVWNAAPGAGEIIAAGPLLNSTTTNFVGWDTRTAQTVVANLTNIRDDAMFAAGDKIYFVSQVVAGPGSMTVVPALAGNALITSGMSIRYLSG